MAETAYSILLNCVRIFGHYKPKQYAEKTMSREKTWDMDESNATQWNVQMIPKDQIFFFFWKIKVLWQIFEIKYLISVDHKRSKIHQVYTSIYFEPVLCYITILNISPCKWIVSICFMGNIHRSLLHFYRTLHLSVAILVVADVVWI